MRGNWVEFTSATGGTGNLTLSELVGYPSVQDIVGTVGTRWMGYTILEWSSGVYSGPPIKAEHGIGQLTLSTFVLARTKKLSTWDGTTYDVTNPAGLNFGTTTANLRVTLAPSMELISPDLIPFYNAGSGLGEDLGLASTHAPISATISMGAANREHYVPFRWNGCGEIIQVGVGVTTGVASTFVKAGIYEVASTGLPGTRLLDLTGATPISTAATPIGVVACSAHLPPGWYYSCILASAATASLRAHRIGVTGTMAGATTAGTNITHFSAVGNYATGLPATAPTGASLTAATTAPPCLFLKPRN